MKQDLHILMLEDDALDADLNKMQLLLLEEYNCIINWVTDKASYLGALQLYTPDIVLSDYNLPQYNGLDALNDLMTINPLIPFIFVTGTINEETAAGTIKAGAWDYVVKDRLFRLPLAIKGVLKIKEERIHTLLAEDQNRKLSMAVEQSPVSIIINNINGIIEYVNEKFTEITGYKAEELIGKSNDVYDQNYFSTDLYKDIWTILKSDKVWKGELQNKKKDGTLYWEYVTVSPLKDEKGKITHFISIKEDITQRKKMEQEIIMALDKAERSDSLKEAFLQNLSHEIRTPLNAIVGFSELLNKSNSKPEQQIEFTTIIVNSSNQLLSIVNDVLAASRIQTGQEILLTQPTSLNEVIDLLYNSFLPRVLEKKLVFNINKVGIFPNYFVTDETKLRQIITNLLNNAIKFTKQGSIELGCQCVNEKLEIYVKDTGIGIAKENQQLIFERFRQENITTSINYGGTGLGLSISKAYAEMMGGSISVESETGKGSVFTLTIPYKCICEEEKIPNKEHRTIKSDNKIILVAEDEEYNFKLIEALLEDFNYVIIHAINGLEAVEICKSNPAISLVLMDIKMPEMDGLTAMIEIRKFREALPIIAQTAYALEHEKQKFLESGFNDYLSKPIKKEDLWEKVQSFFQT